MEMWLLNAYVLLMIVFSFIAIIAYLIDKKRAIKQKERIKEKTLLFFACFFGSVGSIIGRLIARHKTNKSYFSIVIFFSLLVQIASLVNLIYIAFN